MKIYRTIATTRDTLKLEIDSIRMAEWCTKNILELNIDKCDMMKRLRRLANNNQVVEYKINGKQIERVDEIRDNRLNFISHLENSIASARQMTGYIKWLSNGRFHQSSLELLYTAYSGSKLKFAVPIWDPFLAKYKGDIESIQN